MKVFDNNTKWIQKIGGNYLFFKNVFLVHKHTDNWDAKLLKLVIAIILIDRGLSSNRCLNGYFISVGLDEHSRKPKD